MLGVRPRDSVTAEDVGYVLCQSDVFTVSIGDEGQGFVYWYQQVLILEKSVLRSCAFSVARDRSLGDPFQR